MFRYAIAYELQTAHSRTLRSVSVSTSANSSLSGDVLSIHSITPSLSNNKLLLCIDEQKFKLHSKMSTNFILFSTAFLPHVTYQLTESSYISLHIYS